MGCLALDPPVQKDRAEERCQRAQLCRGAPARSSGAQALLRTTQQGPWPGRRATPGRAPLRRAAWDEQGPVGTWFQRPWGRSWIHLFRKLVRRLNLQLQEFINTLPPAGLVILERKGAESSRQDAAQRDLQPAQFRPSHVPRVAPHTSHTCGSHRPGTPSSPHHHAFTDEETVRLLWLRG